MTNDECDPKLMHNHLKNLYRDVDHQGTIPTFPGLKADDVKITHPFDMGPIRQEELEKVFKITSNTRDPYGVYYGVFANLPCTHNYLLTLLTTLLHSRTLDHDLNVAWKHTSVFMQYKKGDAKDPKNYRPIILMGIVVKMFHKILNNRIYNYMTDNGIMDSQIQKGLQRNLNGVMENTILCKEVINDARNGNRDMQMLFLDMENAYGSLRHPFIRYVLNKYQFPKEIATYVSAFYWDATAHIIVDEQFTEPFEWQKGVLQGDALSNVLFVVCMNIILVDLDRKFHHLGYQIGDERTLLMAFVDDIALVTEKEEDAHTVLKELYQILDWCGFRLKPEKSRILRLQQGLPVPPPPTVDAFMMQDQPVLSVGNDGQFKYLGAPITETGDEEIVYKDLAIDLETKFQYVNQMKMGKSYNLKNKDKLWLYITYLGPQIRWKFVNSIWSSAVRQKIEDLESQYLSQWSDKDTHLAILERRRKMVDKRQEYIFKCSTDHRIQALSEKRYGKITDEEKDKIKEKIDAMGKEKCQFYSRMDED